MPREMPKFDKSSPELVARFNAVLDRQAGPDVTRRQMFGYPCAWIGGNMTTGLFADQWWVNGADPDRGRVLAMPGGPQVEGMAGEVLGRLVVIAGQVIGARRVRLLLRPHRLHDPERVLDVVPELVGDDVCLREVAGRSEALAQLVEEGRVEVDLLVRRAVERAGRR